MQLQLDGACVGHHNIMIARHHPSEETNDERGMQQSQPSICTDDVVM
jgi:hypothetical protein